MLEQLLASTAPTPHPPTPPEKHLVGVKSQSDKLERKFSILVQKCFKFLVQQKITGGEVAACLMSLSVRIRDDHEEFLEKDLGKVDEESRLMHVWRELLKYSDFFNYVLIEHIINTIGNDTLQTDMEAYISELKFFHKKTKLCEFVENWPQRRAKPPEDKFRTFVAKMELDWDKCTLEDIERFREALTQKFFPKNSTLLLKEISRGCVTITWYIPDDVATAVKRNLQNTRDRELLKVHRVEWLKIDGEECSYSPLKQYANFLKDTYTSESSPAALTLAPPSDTPLHFSLAKIEREQISKETTDSFAQSTLRGDQDDIPRRKTPISFNDVGKLRENAISGVVLIEGAPGVGKSTFSWEYCRRWARGELLQTMSLVLLLPLRDNRIKTSTNLTDLFYHSDIDLRQQIVQELKSSRGEGVVIWLEGLDEFGQPLGEQPSIFLDLILGKILPKATIFITSRPRGSQFLPEQHEHRITQHVEILGSPAEQIEAVAKSDTSTSIHKQFLTYISEQPVIKAAMYTPVTRVMILEVFNSSLAKNTNPPATMTQLYTTYTCKRLSDYLSHHPQYDTQQWTIHKFTDLPPQVHFHFRELCELAYRGIENNQQIIFYDLPPGFETLGLLQEVHPLYTRETSSSSYNFPHLTVQEFLAAVHISELPPGKQTSLFWNQMEHTESHYSGFTIAFGNYTMVFRFLCGLTKMIHISTLITDQMLKSEDMSNLFHWMYEAQDNERTSKTLGLSEIQVDTSRYSLSPLDNYVTGYCISHSHCPWRLRFRSSCFDDEKMEMLSRGCCTALDSTYTGYISKVDLSGNTLTSIGIEHFTQLPPHILQSIRVLKLEDDKLNREACNLLATIIATMISLEKLNLGNNHLDSGGAVELINALCGYTRLRKLNMWKTNIGENDCKCISGLLASNQTITWLSLGYNSLSPVSVDHIISGLFHNSSLTYLDMHCSKFSEDNTVRLSTVLQNMNKCKLEEVHLANCDITGIGAGHLANSLHTNSTLKTLRLNNNPIGVDGATAVGAMLLVNTSLERLCLEEGYIRPGGACAIATALYTNSTLKVLELDWNPIGVDGATAIAAMLIVNTSLKVLKLSNCSIRAYEARKLAKALHTNSSLKVLQLNDNFIGVFGAIAFARMLLVNTSLLKLDLSDDSICEEGVRWITGCLELNGTLRMLQLPIQYEHLGTWRILWC